MQTLVPCLVSVEFHMYKKGVIRNVGVLKYMIALSCGRVILAFVMKNP